MKYTKYEIWHTTKEVKNNGSISLVSATCDTPEDVKKYKSFKSACFDFDNIIRRKCECYNSTNASAQVNSYSLIGYLADGGTVRLDHVSDIVLFGKEIKNECMVTVDSWDTAKSFKSKKALSDAAFYITDDIIHGGEAYRYVSVKCDVQPEIYFYKTSNNTWEEIA